MDPHVSPPTPALQIVAILPADALSRQHGPAVTDAPALDFFACDFASPCSGRMLRAQIESLLI